MQHRAMKMNRKAVKQPKTLRQLRLAVRQWLPWWRDRLGLRDWHIDVQYVDAVRMSGKGSLRVGESEPDYAQRKAILRFITPAAITDCYGKDADVEEVIVHELMHIPFGAIGVGLCAYEGGRMSKGALAESIINDLARALVKARRGTL